MSPMERLSSERLLTMSYRELQKIGKSLHVPCNIKKAYLSDVIWYWLQGNQVEALAIAEKAKNERKKHARPRQKKRARTRVGRVKLSEASSTNRLTPSPPITRTPLRKRPILVQQSSVPYKTIGKTTIAKIVNQSVPNLLTLKPEERDVHTQTCPDIQMACSEIIKSRQYPIYEKAAKRLTSSDATDDVVSSSQDLDMVIKSSSLRKQLVQVGEKETYLPQSRKPHEMEHDYDQPLDFTVKRELLVQNNNEATLDNYNYLPGCAVENSTNSLYSSAVQYQSTEADSYSHVMYRNLVHTENYNLQNNYPGVTEHAMYNTQVDYNMYVKNVSVYEEPATYFDLQNAYLPNQHLDEFNRNIYEMNLNASVQSQNTNVEQQLFMQNTIEQNIVEKSETTPKQCCEQILNSNEAFRDSYTQNMITNAHNEEQNIDNQNVFNQREQLVVSHTQIEVEIDSLENTPSQEYKNTESYFHKKIRIKSRRLSEAVQRTVWSDESSDSSDEPDYTRSSGADACNVNSSEVVLPRFINAFVKLGHYEKDPYEPLYVNVDGPSFTSTPVARRLSLAPRRHSMPVETDISVEDQLRCDAAGSLLKIASSIPYSQPPADTRALVPYARDAPKYSNLTDVCEPDIPYLKEYLRDTDPMDAFSMGSSYSGSATEDLEALASQVEDMDSVSSGTVLSGMGLLRFDATDNLGATVTVGDSLRDTDLSQDYMSVSQVDSVQCALCEWNRSAEELEEHIVMVHYAEIKVLSATIHREEPISLGSLVREKRKAVIFRWLGKLYALVVKYEDPEWLMASLSTLTPLTETPLHTSITTYNKVSGQPYSWEGPSLRTNLGFTDPDAYLKVQLSKINVMPNSANVLLSNGGLVSLSRDRQVVCGSEMLDEIDIWFKVGFY